MGRNGKRVRSMWMGDGKRWGIERVRRWVKVEGRWEEREEMERR